MKPTIYTACCVSLIFAAFSVQAQTNIFPSTGAAGIGTITPNASSLLEVKSTKKGILIPRMTQTQRNAITSPATALLIFQTDNTPGFYYYSGSAWTAISTKGANTSLSNLKAPTAINADLLPVHDSAYSLGSLSIGWRDIYAQRFYFENGYKVIDIGDGLNCYLGNTGVHQNGGDGGVYVGTNAGKNNSSGNSNTGIGYYALTTNTTGSGNIALGAYSLYDNI